MAFASSGGEVKIDDSTIKKNASGQIYCTSQVPVGGVCAWFKSMANCPSLPDDFVECNGQTLSDADSVFNGQTIPDLNGYQNAAIKRYLRGGGSGDGATPTASDDGSGNTAGGTETHTHSISRALDTVQSGGGKAEVTSSTTGSTATLPSYYSCVWVMRIK